MQSPAHKVFQRTSDQTLCSISDVVLSRGLKTADMFLYLYPSRKGLISVIYDTLGFPLFIFNLKFFYYANFCQCSATGNWIFQRNLPEGLTKFYLSFILSTKRCEQSITDNPYCNHLQNESADLDHSSSDRWGAWLQNEQPQGAVPPYVSMEGSSGEALKVG